MQSSLYGLIESASRQLARTKPEMEAVLGTLHQLGLDRRAEPEYLRGLEEAMDILQQCVDVPSFLSRLRGEPPNLGSLRGEPPKLGSLRGEPPKLGGLRKFVGNLWNILVVAVIIAAWLTHIAMAGI